MQKPIYTKSTALHLKKITICNKSNINSTLSISNNIFKNDPQNISLVFFWQIEKSKEKFWEQYIKVKQFD